MRTEAQTRSSVPGLRALGSFLGNYFSKEEKPRFVKQGQNLRDSIFREGGTLQYQQYHNTGSTALQLGRLGSVWLAPYGRVPEPPGTLLSSSGKWVRPVSLGYYEN